MYTETEIQQIATGYVPVMEQPQQFYPRYADVMHLFEPIQPHLRGLVPCGLRWAVEHGDAKKGDYAIPPGTQRQQYNAGNPTITLFDIAVPAEYVLFLLVYRFWPTRLQNNYTGLNWQDLNGYLISDYAIVNRYTTRPHDLHCSTVTRRIDDVFKIGLTLPGIDDTTVDGYEDAVMLKRKFYWRQAMLKQGYLPGHVQRYLHAFSQAVKMGRQHVEQWKMAHR